MSYYSGMKPAKALEYALARAETSVVKAAEAMGTVPSQIERAVYQVRSDPALLAAFHARRAAAARDLHDDRVLVLRAGLAELLRRIGTMDDKELIQAVQAVAELHEVADVALREAEGVVNVEHTVTGRGSEEASATATVRHTYRAGH